MGESFQLCIFDLRRGQHEGQELDKILFFYPPATPYSSQLSLIGLSEGIITFTKIFSPSTPCELIEADKHSHVFHQSEPDIWLVALVEKSNNTDSAFRYTALRAVLQELHSLFTTFHGPLRGLLDKQPSGELARGYLYSFAVDYLNDFVVGRKVQMPCFRECLRERGTVQMLTISREVAIEVQSLVTALGSSAGNTICNSVVLFQDLLVGTTLPPGDTVSLFTYAVMRLTPHALSCSTSSWSYLRKAASAANVASFSGEEAHHTSRDTSPGGECQRHHIPRPLQRGKWSRGKDGFVVSDIWGDEVGNLVSPTQTVWLQQMEERMYVCVYQHKNLTVILLIPVASLTDGEQSIALVKKNLVENASQKIVNVEEKLSRGWGGENAYHVSGYRYLLTDTDTHISRASPAGKVTTLSKDSLIALSKLREEVDLEKARAERDNPEHEKELEVCVRARNNAWVIAKITRGRELYMVLEKASETLLYASDALEKFSNKYCDGAFSLG